MNRFYISLIVMLIGSALQAADLSYHGRRLAAEQARLIQMEQQAKQACEATHKNFQQANQEFFKAAQEKVNPRTVKSIYAVKPTLWNGFGVWGGKPATNQQEYEQQLQKNLEQASAKSHQAEAQAQQTYVQSSNAVRVQEEYIAALKEHKFPWWQTWKGGTAIAAAMMGGYMLWRAGLQGCKKLACLDVSGFWQAVKNNGVVPQQHSTYPRMLTLAEQTALLARLQRSAVIQKPQTVVAAPQSVAAKASPDRPVKKMISRNRRVSPMRKRPVTARRGMARAHARRR